VCRAAALAVGALLVALVAGGAVASAHANLDRAEPAPDSTLAAPPAAVRIWFTEPIAPGVSEIQVLDALGRRVDHGDSKIDLGNPTLLTVTLPALTDGTYTVAWKNTSSVDGHPFRGTYAFTVGIGTGGARGDAGTPGSGTTATSGVPGIDPVLRWAVLAGLLVALGAQGFALAVLAPVLAAERLRDALPRV
jgi:methionine-rich copper-binding protein CopC